MEDNLVNEENIIKLLCKKRIKLRQKNRKDNFVKSISSSKDLSLNSDLVNLLPPRKHWPRPSKKSRLSCTDYDSMYSKYLASFVDRQYKDCTVKYAWKDKLNAFIAKCLDKYKNIENNEISPEKILPISKDTSPNCKKFRVIAVYSLEDSILNSLVAKRLTDLIDCSLSKCCYSFRSSVMGVSKVHHDAVQDIMTFSSSIPEDETLWVAECDIQAFFDCISHDLTISKLKKLEEKYSILSPENSKIYQYAKKFLKGYSYKLAREEAINNHKFRFMTNFVIFDNEFVLKQVETKDNHESFGVPQGSALSTVFANMVLDDTDKKIENILNDKESFYARFCDDVIFISSNYSKCTLAINQYCSDLREMKLPYHELEHVSVQDKNFWKKKSKNPYKWIRKSKGTGVCWIGFVGYQMNRNGKIRIRKSSLEKEINKQQETIKLILKNIKKQTSNSVKNNTLIKFEKIDTIEKKVCSHLVARSVGMRHFAQKSTKFKTWSSGFKLLSLHNADKAQLRSLDVSRGRAMKKLRGCLFEVAKNDRAKFCKNKRLKKNIKFFPYYFGRPYSYYCVFDS